MEVHLEAGKESKPSSTSADLQGDSSLQVEISDAVSERDKVKFTVQTKSCVPHFSRPEFSVVRHHEEFIWLHNAYVENAEYAGLILCPSLEQIPPAPPRPDFEASREKLQKLGEGDSSITREEFAKMKEELEAEYLAIFKKTVAMHEVFLQRLAAHPTLRRDHNFFVFLEYSQDLSVRGKNRKELLGGFLRNIVKSADEALITGMSGLKEVDDFFEHERTFLLEYHTRIRDACLRADQVMHSHKCVADDYIPISAALSSLGTQEVNQLKTSFLKLAELFERLRKLEGRVASDEDLKLSDMLRYYVRDSQAAKDLLYRRLRALADYENANKALDKARTRNREVRSAERHQQLCCQRFERLSDSAKQGKRHGPGGPAAALLTLPQCPLLSPPELVDFRCRRVSSFRKNLTELAELELKHAKASTLLLRNTLVILKGEP
ncbi:sorting nexin-32 isoform X4 [Mesoplodon densirostris]|uniref:sorting nexin-32 isoform X4 n=1 Tax=Mesoplodon densirostris TaxID=48708 RepID=UPI0028DB100E|nr:sorting nexin-32 isoform X4 [Mesoplodon densirostris]